MYEVFTNGEDSNIEFFGTETMEVKYNCKKFKSMGYLCSHALKIFSIKDVIHIPEMYFLVRWAKDVRKRVHKLEMEEYSKKGLIEP